MRCLGDLEEVELQSGLKWVPDSETAGFRHPSSGMRLIAALPFRIDIKIEKGVPHMGTTTPGPTPGMRRNYSPDQNLKNCTETDLHFGFEKRCDTRVWGVKTYCSALQKRV